MTSRSLLVKRIDCFLLSTTVFSQLLIDNFDDTRQNLGSMTNVIDKNSRRSHFASSVNSLIPVRSAAWNDPNLITQKCFLPRGWNSFKSTVITTDNMSRESHRTLGPDLGILLHVLIYCSRFPSRQYSSKPTIITIHYMSRESHRT